jgi:hypothetical protein
MMLNRPYRFVGISTDPKGRTKLRLTNDSVTQTKRYKRKGHIGVNFLPLPIPMTKIEAAEYVLHSGEVSNQTFFDAAFHVVSKDISLSKSSNNSA